MKMSLETSWVSNTMVLTKCESMMVGMLGKEITMRLMEMNYVSSLMTYILV